MKRTYFVTLRESVLGVRLVSWRRKGQAGHKGAAFIPHALGMFLELMPEQSEGARVFSDILYGIKKLEEIAPTMVERITTRGPGIAVVTVTL